MSPKLPPLCPCKNPEKQVAEDVPRKNLGLEKAPGNEVIPEEQGPVTVMRRLEKRREEALSNIVRLLSRLEFRASGPANIAATRYLPTTR